LRESVRAQEDDEQQREGTHLLHLVFLSTDSQTYG